MTFARQGFLFPPQPPLPSLCLPCYYNHPCLLLSFSFASATTITTSSLYSLSQTPFQFHFLSFLPPQSLPCFHNFPSPDYTISITTLPSSSSSPRYRSRREEERLRQSLRCSGSCDATSWIGGLHHINDQGSSPGNTLQASK